MLFYALHCPRRQRLGAIINDKAGTAMLFNPFANMIRNLISLTANGKLLPDAWTQPFCLKLSVQHCRRECGNRTAYQFEVLVGVVIFIHINHSLDPTMRT